MTGLNYLGLIMMLLPLLLAWMVGRHDAPVEAAVMIALVAIVGGYYVAAAALLVM